MPSKSATSKNHAYLPGPSDFLSGKIYLYYLTHTQPDIRLYFLEVANMDILSATAEVISVAAQVKSGGYPKQPDGTRFGAKPWEYISYFAVVLDDSDRLIKDDAVNFMLLPGMVGNHSFRGGKDIDIPGTNLTGFICMNRMLHKSGKTLKEHQRENFWITVNHNSTGSRVDGSIRSHEDAGVNLGPPK